MVHLYANTKGLVIMISACLPSSADVLLIYASSARQVALSSTLGIWCSFPMVACFLGKWEPVCHNRNLLTLLQLKERVCAYHSCRDLASSVFVCSRVYGTAIQLSTAIANKHKQCLRMLLMRALGSTLNLWHGWLMGGQMQLQPACFLLNPRRGGACNGFFRVRDAVC
jgi:hypothetical protein